MESFHHPKALGLRLDRGGRARPPRKEPSCPSFLRRRFLGLLRRNGWGVSWNPGMKSMCATPIIQALFFPSLSHNSAVLHLHSHDVKLFMGRSPASWLSVLACPRPALKLIPEHLLHPQPRDQVSTQAPTEPLLHQAGVTRILYESFCILFLTA